MNTCESRGVQYRGQMGRRVGGGRMKNECSGSEYLCTFMSTYEYLRIIMNTTTYEYLWGNTYEFRGVQCRGEMGRRVGGGRMKNGCSGSEG